MFYDRYLEMCTRKGVTPHKAALENGLSNAAPSIWKKRGIRPSAENLEKLASYFGCSVDYLLEKEPEGQKESHPADSREARKQELMQILDTLTEAEQDALLLGLKARYFPGE